MSITKSHLDELHRRLFFSSAVDKITRADITDMLFEMGFSPQKEPVNRRIKLMERYRYITNTAPGEWKNGKEVVE